MKFFFTIISMGFPLLVVAAPKSMDASTSKGAAQIATEADATDAQDDASLTLDEDCRHPYDPLEKLNRAVFYFNGFLDYVLLNPIAKGYGHVTNVAMRRAITNSLDNLTTPFTTVNYTLQAKGGKALMSFWSFMANTVLGAGGMADVASTAGVKVPQQGLGDTLGRYGVGPGPVLVVPFLGMTNMRDVWDLTVADTYGNPLNRVKFMSKNSLWFTAARTVTNRYKLTPFVGQMAKMPDPYVAVRSAMHDMRESEIDYPKGYECGYKKSK